jgi:SulP family sulfate permease
VFQFQGPLFFGAASGLAAVLTNLSDWPKVLILRMRQVPLIDATGADALEELASLADRNGCRIIVSGLQQQPREALHRLAFFEKHHAIITSNSYIAIEKAKKLTGMP